MSKRVLVLIGLFLACGGVYSQTATGTKTNFQTAESWKPETDVRADAVMVYGTLDKKGVTFEQRVQSWRDKGYRVEFMTGVAWGDYQRGPARPRGSGQCARALDPLYCAY